MAYTTIDDPTKYFDTTLWTGDGGARTITGLNHKPDLIWTKTRSVAYNHMLSDSSRGFNANSELGSNSTAAEGGLSAETYGYKSGHTADGWTMVDGTDTNDNQEDGNTNQPSVTYVGWTWAANGGTATATGSESGNNPAYSVQANTTAGFSVVTYTGTGSNGTVPHGLGVKPDWYIIKNRDNANANDGRWMVWHKSLEASYNYYSFIFLHLTNSRSEGTTVVNATPNTTTFALGDDGMINNDGQKYVAYCFAEKQGYSKFGSYTGNGNADGTFVHTGFKPAWVMIKEYAANTNDWNIYDSKRSAFNSMDDILEANLSDAEGTGRADIDFVSNGFKQRNTHADSNRSSGKFIYMAFAEHPFVSSKGVPATAR